MFHSTSCAGAIRVRAIALAALAFGMLVTSCSNGDAEPTSVTPDVAVTPAYLTITNPIVPELPVGASVTLAALATDESGKPLESVSLTWTSSDDAIATVSKGVVTAHSVGDAVISAAASGRSASAKVKVVESAERRDSVVVPPTAAPAPAATIAPVRTITVVITNSALAIGVTSQATATLHGEGGTVLTDRPVTWASSNVNVATVSASGLVTTLAVGKSQITAHSGEVAGNVSVTVLTTTTPTPPAPTPTPPAPTPPAPTPTPPAPTPTPPAPVPTPPVTFAEKLAELPRVYVDTRMPAAPAAGGKVITVSAGGNLQNALNSALPGDVIALENGATFSGNFTLPNKNSTSTKWITIRPATMNGMPAEGVRMTPAVAAAVRLPKIMSVNNMGAFSAAIGAHHFRLIGLEVSVPATIANTGLVRFEAQHRTVAEIPHHLVLDRSYVHGTATGSVRRCVSLNSATSAVIDSYISDCHDASTDAQAIAGWNGPGPFKIVNNYLEGSGENISWGGGDPTITNMIAADIEIRRNHLFKPLSWKRKWLVKNLYESKASTRVLIEGNIFENNWQHGQNGSAFNLKSSNQDGKCTACGTSDVTIRYNLIHNTGSGFVLSGAPDYYPTTVHMQRITIMDNVISGINTGSFDGDGYGVLLNGDPADVVFAHNTVISPTNGALVFGGPQGAVIRATFRDNVMGGGTYGVKGGGVTPGTPSMIAFMPGSQFIGNVLILGNAAGYPGGNFYPATISAVGFQNAGAFDFRLSSSSPFRLKATDGRDPGADVAAVNAAISGVIVP